MAKSARDDRLLVQECLLGSEEAWSALIDKYKNLIFSIPLKYGFSPEDATEIFQTVSLALLRDLSQLREPRALAAWLIRLTARTCVRARQERKIYVDAEIDDEDLAEKEKLPETLFQEIEREQIFRESLSNLSPECRRLVELLFFADPPRRYDEAARALGLSTGSIGATRMRCLEKLRHFLEKKGFR
ncbi:MAG TPA: sigma-70 family RNA polymerase sigma factor [Bryobacteraceae bacterium]|nr:sigma-70 family RNA polymerase sigma factor [Bryobacteraceae bacterium]